MQMMRDAWDVAAITNDIYTREDAEFLTRSGALDPCDHGRRDGRLPAHRNSGGRLDQPRRRGQMNKRFPVLDLIFIEVGWR